VANQWGDNTKRGRGFTGGEEEYKEVPIGRGEGPKYRECMKDCKSRYQPAETCGPKGDQEGGEEEGKFFASAPPDVSNLNWNATSARN